MSSDGSGGSQRFSLPPNRPRASIAVNSYENYTEGVGGWGRYQQAVMGVSILAAAVAGGNVRAMFFAHLPPEVVCDSVLCADDTTPSLEDFCDNRTLLSAQGYNLTGESYLTDWGIACNDRYLLALPDCAFFTGWLVGGLAIGKVADTFGRRLPLVCIGVLCALSLAGTALANDIETMCIAKFLHGICTGGTYLLLYVFGAEHLFQRFALFGTVFFMSGAAGAALLALLAYAVHPWVAFTLILSGISLATAVLPLLLYESPQYLYSVALKRLEGTEYITVFGVKNYEGVQEDAAAALERFHSVMVEIATVNGTLERYLGVSDLGIRNFPGLPQRNHRRTVGTWELPTMRNQPLRAPPGFGDSIPALGRTQQRRRRSSQPFAWFNDLIPQAETEAPQTAPTTFFAKLIEYPKLRRAVFGMATLWGAASLLYFGLTLSGAALPGDAYFNAAALGLIEMAVYPLQYNLVEVKGVGRKGTAMGALTIGALCCLTASLTETLGEGVKWFAFAGMFFLAGAFTTVYIWASELFPADVRGTGMGIATAGGKLGSIGTPFLLALQQSSMDVAMKALALVAVLGLAAAAFLPETLEAPDYQTVEDFAGGGCMVSGDADHFGGGGGAMSERGSVDLYGEWGEAMGRGGGGGGDARGRGDTDSTEHPPAPSPATPEPPNPRPLTLPLPAHEATPLFGHELLARPISQRYE